MKSLPTSLFQRKELPLFDKWFDLLTILSLSKERGEGRFANDDVNSVLKPLIITQCLYIGETRIVSKAAT